MRRKEMRSNIELGPGENVVLNFVCGYILAVFCRSCIVKCFRNSNTKKFNSCIQRVSKTCKQNIFCVACKFYLPLGF